MNIYVFTLLWIISICYASKNYSKMRVMDYVVIALLTYGMYDAWKHSKTDENFTADGYSEGMDQDAYKNLHRIVKELYKDDTLTIPGNLRIEGKIIDGLTVDRLLVDEAATINGNLTMGSGKKIFMPNGTIDLSNLYANSVFTNNVFNNTVDRLNLKILNHKNVHEWDSGGEIELHNKTKLHQDVIMNQDVLMPHLGGDNRNSNTKGDSKGGLWTDGRALRIIKKQ